jgi:hypothetical protein
MELENPAPGHSHGNASKSAPALVVEHEVATTSAVVAKGEALQTAIVDALAAGAATIDDLSESDRRTRKVKQ